MGSLEMSPLVLLASTDLATCWYTESSLVAASRSVKAGSSTIDSVVVLRVILFIM